MNQELTEIVVLMDASGSMGVSVNDVIGGFKTFLQEQRKCHEGYIRLTLIQFSSLFPQHVVYNRAMLDDVNLTAEQYKPLGGTPLYDALAMAITTTGNKLAAMQEYERPGKVVFLVITDGEENASKEFTGPVVQAMVKHQESTYQWQFVYIGADVDAFAQASAVAIDKTKTANFVRNKAGYINAFRAVGSNVAGYRSSNEVQAMSFTEDQRSMMAADVGEAHPAADTQTPDKPVECCGGKCK